MIPRARGSRPSESKSLSGGESSAVLGCPVTAPPGSRPALPLCHRDDAMQPGLHQETFLFLGSRGKGSGDRFPTPSTCSSRIKLQAVSKLLPPLGFPRSLIFQVPPTPDDCMILRPSHNPQHQSCYLQMGNPKEVRLPRGITHPSNSSSNPNTSKFCLWPPVHTFLIQSPALAGPGLCPPRWTLSLCCGVQVAGLGCNPPHTRSICKK